MNTLKEKFALLEPHIDEKIRRLIAAAETIGGSRGIKGEVSRATGVSYREIQRGLRELREIPEIAGRGRIRKEGGGRKSIANPRIFDDLKGFVESSARGQPGSPLLWTNKSLRSLTRELKAMGHTVSHPTVGVILERMGYQLRSSRKAREGSNNDRDAQFSHICETVTRFQARGEPVIFVDCRKLVMEHKYNGMNRQSVIFPKIEGHDFIVNEAGKIIPRGLAGKSGFLNTGVNHDASAFAVETIRGWWHYMGKARYPRAARLLVTANHGSGRQDGIWKDELVKFARETGLKVTVCHFPAGTSRWNRIEHRLVSYNMMNWRGRPLTVVKVIVNLIAPTKTKPKLTAECLPDEHLHANKWERHEKEIDVARLLKDAFRTDWNYTVSP